MGYNGYGSAFICSKGYDAWDIMGMGVHSYVARDIMDMGVHSYVARDMMHDISWIGECICM